MGRALGILLGNDIEAGSTATPARGSAVSQVLLAVPGELLLVLLLVTVSVAATISLRLKVQRDTEAAIRYIPD